MSGDEVGHVVEAWRREGRERVAATVGTTLALTRLADLVGQRRAEVLGRHGVDAGQLDVLGALRRSGPPYRLTAGELTRRCRVTPGATTQRVAALERLGHVERVREEPDRRTVHVQLTATGRACVDAAADDVATADASVLDVLTPAQRATLEDALRTWLHAATSSATLS